MLFRPIHSPGETSIEGEFLIEPKKGFLIYCSSEKVAVVGVPKTKTQSRSTEDWGGWFVTVVVSIGAVIQYYT